MVQNGTGTLTLGTANTYTGPTVVSNGVLAASTVGGDMDVDGGTLVPGAVGAVGALTVAGNLNISAGTVSVLLNTLLDPSNSTVSVTGNITVTGGTLQVANAGPLAAGDTFTIFNQAVSGLTLVAPAGVTFANNLAVNGSITVASVIAPNLALTCNPNGSLSLSWTGSDILQAQTNSVTGTWYNYPGGGTSPVTLPIDPTQKDVFFRLAP